MSVFVCLSVSFLIIGKLGMQGFAELEYGMLRYMGAIDDSTPIVTTGMLASFSLFIFVKRDQEKE